MKLDDTGAHYTAEEMARLFPHPSWVRARVYANYVMTWGSVFAPLYLSKNRTE